VGNRLIFYIIVPLNNKTIIYFAKAINLNFKPFIGGDTWFFNGNN